MLSTSLPTNFKYPIDIITQHSVTKMDSTISTSETVEVETLTTTVLTLAPSTAPHEDVQEIEPIILYNNQSHSALGNKNAPVIWINGFPGTGKRTIAVRLLNLLGSDRATLIDNHQHADRVTVSRRHPHYWHARNAELSKVLQAHVLSRDTLSKTVIFTDYQSDSGNSFEAAMEYLKAAKQARRPFLPVSITCQEDENVRRMTNASRCWTEDGTRRMDKSTDAKILRRARMLSLFDFDEVCYYEDTKMDGLVIDVTELQPEEVAAKIMQRLEAV